MRLLRIDVERRRISHQSVGEVVRGIQSISARTELVEAGGGTKAWILVPRKTIKTTAIEKALVIVDWTRRLDWRRWVAIMNGTMVWSISLSFSCVPTRWSSKTAFVLFACVGDVWVLDNWTSRLDGVCVSYVRTLWVICALKNSKPRFQDLKIVTSGQSYPFSNYRI